jgi:hypothetical protein
MRCAPRWAPGRPHAEHRAGAIGDDRHPPAVEAAEGLGQEAAAGLHRARGDRVGVVDPHVRGPSGRQSGPRGRADRGHVAPAQPAHVVPRVRTGPGALLHVPAEHGGIEPRRRVGVFLPGVNPAGDAVLVPVALGQGRSLGKRSPALSAAASGARWAPLPLSAEMRASSPRCPRLRSERPTTAPIAREQIAASPRGAVVTASRSGAAVARPTRERGARRSGHSHAHGCRSPATAECSGATRCARGSLRRRFARPRGRLPPAEVLDLVYRRARPEALRRSALRD